VRPRKGARFELKQVRNPRQNEATEYGSAFARALSLTVGQYRYVFVSGTASIDEQGATIHVGDFEAQTRRTIENVVALLASAKASLRDLRQATAFLKRASDAPAHARLVGATGLGDVPIVTTVADVCRDDLLYELDATAVVSLAGSAKS